MADSSPGIQNSSSNYLAEFGQLGQSTPDSHLASNLTAQKETSARLASEALAGRDPQSGGVEGVKRATSVLAGGLADGVVNSAEHSLNWHTAGTVAESLAIGYGLGALAKAGPVGQKLAMAGGLVMGATWLYSEFERGRPQATVAAVADAYDSKANIAQDRQTVATNGGALAFETGLAFAAGGFGMKKGLELNSNWHVDAIAGVKSSYGSAIAGVRSGYGTAVDFLARDGRVNGAHVLDQGDMGMAFAGRDANAPPSAMSLAKEIISGKEKGSTSLSDIQQTFVRSEVKRNDAHLLDTRSKLVDLETEHSKIRAEETALQPKLNNATKDKVALESTTSLEQTVKFRQQALADAQQAARDIPVKKRELDKLFTDKQAAFEKQKPKDGVPVDPQLRQDFQTKHQNFLEVKASYEELKANGSTEAIQKHRESLEEAQAALTQARQDQPAKLAAAQGEIDEINQQLTALKTRRLAIEDQVKPLVEAYNTRLDAVIKDPTKLVQAQFEPPAPKAPAVVKPPAADLRSTDLQPGLVGADGKISLRPGDTAGATTALAAESATILEQATAHVAEPIAQPAPAEAPIIAAKTEPVFAEKAPVNGAAATDQAGGAHTDQTAGRTDRPATARQAVVQERTTGDATAEPKVDTKEAAGIKRLSPEAQVSREAALKAVKSNELVRERDYATKVLGDIERGTYRPARGASTADVKIEMERRLTDVSEKLKGDPGIKYTRALKSVLQYTRSVGKQLADTPDSGMRDGITEQALTDIEGMMGRLPTSYKGIQGNLPDLAEPGRLGRTGSPEGRLAEVSNHLEEKVSYLDNSRARQVADMAERQPTLNEIMRRLNASELPDDGSIILIGKNGKYLGPQGGTSPYFIEVARMKGHGVGADGGGFNRFEAIQDNIAGAVVLRPIYENGKPVELPNRNSGGKPVYKKIVSETFGAVPEGITANLNFVDILRRFAPAR